MTVTKVDAIAAGQAAYVQKLADMFNSGVATLRVFDSGKKIISGLKLRCKLSGRFSKIYCWRSNCTP